MSTSAGFRFSSPTAAPGRPTGRPPSRCRSPLSMPRSRACCGSSPGRRRSSCSPAALPPCSRPARSSSPCGRCPNQVSKAEGEITELSGQLLALQEEERQRIARELHDSTAQHLVAANLGLGRLEANSSRARPACKTCGEIGSLLDRGAEGTAHLHLPAASAEPGERRLAGHACGTSPKASPGGPGSSPASGSPRRSTTLSPEIQRAILRVVQEALANVHRHAGASHVHVGARIMAGRAGRPHPRQRPGHDGPTRPDGPIRLGVGIPGMQARLRAVRRRPEDPDRIGGHVVVAMVPLSGAARGFRRSLPPADRRGCRAGPRRTAEDSPEISGSASGRFQGFAQVQVAIRRQVYAAVGPGLPAAPQAPVGRRKSRDDTHPDRRRSRRRPLRRAGRSWRRRRAGRWSARPADGKEAIDQALATRPDVVVLDYSLAGDERDRGDPADPSPCSGHRGSDLHHARHGDPGARGAGGGRPGLSAQIRCPALPDRGGGEPGGPQALLHGQGLRDAARNLPGERSDAGCRC